MNKSSEDRDFLAELNAYMDTFGDTEGENIMKDMINELVALDLDATEEEETDND